MAEANGWLRPLDLDEDLLRDGKPLEIGDLVDLAPDEDLVDDVVVERLVAGAKWRDIGATRADRIAAAEILYARYLRETAHLDRADLADATRDRTRISDIERHLGLRIRRDFGVRPAEEAIAS